MKSVAHFIQVLFFALTALVGCQPLEPGSLGSIPRFGVNNPNPFFQEARESGAQIAKLLPLEWSAIEPFPPVSVLKPISEYTLADFGVDSSQLDRVPSEMRRGLREKFENLKKKAASAVASGKIRAIRDESGRWHHFNWSAFDEFVEGSQRAGMESTVVLHLNTLWASSVDCLIERRRVPRGNNCPLRNPALSRDLTFFVQSLVERYDGDGKDDMPGLRLPVRYWSDGNEYNVPAFWFGSNAEYLTAWKAFAKGVRQAAGKSAYILANGIADVNEVRKETTDGKFSPCKALEIWVEESIQDGRIEASQVPAGLSSMCHNKTEDQILEYLASVGQPEKVRNAVQSRFERRRRSVEFFFQQLDHPELYDFFVPHVYTYFRYDPTRVSEEMSFVFSEMAKRGYRKPVMSEELAGAYLRDRAQGDRLSQGEATLRAIRSGDEATTVHYYREQAIEMVKLHTTMFAHGVDSLIRFPYRDITADNPWGGSGYAVQGMVVVDWEKREISVKKPSYFTYQLMTNKLNGFQSARELRPGIIEFRFADPKRPRVYALWSNEGNEIRDFSSLVRSSQVLATPIITELDGGQPVIEDDVIYSTSRIPLTDVPIFVQEH